MKAIKDRPRVDFEEKISTGNEVKILKNVFFTYFFPSPQAPINNQFQYL